MTALSSLDASKLTVSITKTPLPIPPSERASTKSHTDHILTATWTATQGWSAPKIAPYSSLILPPTANVLHYATACFEGMKLYRGYDGRLRLFRPIDNCQRMLDSATRISLPDFEPRELLELIKGLCRLEGPRWLPKETSSGRCLYVRPTMIGVDADLGFHVPQEVLLYIIITHWPSMAPPPLSIPGQRRPSGLRLYANTEKAIRAWPGGAGSAKVAANYGPALQTHEQAKKKGFHQVLWLFGPERRVTEAGSSNFFVIWETSSGQLELATPPVESGLILPGITRRSVLELARSRFSNSAEWCLDGNIVLATKLDVAERDLTIFDVMQAAEEGRLLSAFVVGTAYFIEPVSQISFQDHDVSIDTAKTSHSALLRNWLSDIMFGAEQSEWIDVVEG